MSSKIFQLLTALLFAFGCSEAKNDTNECGKSLCCFLVPSGCKAPSCDILITFHYNSITKALDVAIGTKRKWMAFGVNTVPKQMSQTSGEVCFKDSAATELNGFENKGFTPNFRVSKRGLSIKSLESKNGFITCRYSRPIIPPPGPTYMQNLNHTLFITSAFGDKVSGGLPQQHKFADTASSPKKVNFLAPCSISSSNKLPQLVIVHGCLMIIAWVFFASSGIFIARYMRPVGKDSLCCGKKIWFQAHRICMLFTLMLIIAAIVAIVIHRGGWSSGMGLHPIFGCVVAGLTFIQPILAVFRPDPDSKHRWVFNLVHRTIGVAVLCCSAATIVFGLKLVSLSWIPIIVWPSFFVFVFLIMELVLFCFPKIPNEKNEGNEYEPISVDKTLQLRKLVIPMTIIFFGALAAVNLYYVIKEGF